MAENIRKTIGNVLEEAKSIYVIIWSGFIIGDVSEWYFFSDVIDWTFSGLVMQLEENKFGECPSSCRVIKWLLLDSFP